MNWETPIDSLIHWFPVSHKEFQPEERLSPNFSGYFGTPHSVTKDIIEGAWGLHAFEVFLVTITNFETKTEKMFHTYRKQSTDVSCE